MTNPTDNALMARIKELEEALRQIYQEPVNMVNDSDSLRHSVAIIRNIAKQVLYK